MSHLIVVRHGATTLSAAGLFVGRTDPPLSDRGRAQARSWRAFAQAYPGAHVYHSPLARAEQTAILGAFPSPTRSDLLLEWDLGELEGVVADDYRSAHPDWSLFVDGPPNGSGERPEAVAARAHEAVRSLYEPLPDGAIAVLVAHGQFLKVLATVILGLPLAKASSFALGPGRAGIFSRRRTGQVAMTGWNSTAPQCGAGFFDDLT